MNIRKLLIQSSLYLILIIAVILRLWNLGGNPPHLSPDEAALGYNAYSILTTGRDFWGEKLPILFKSFGDYTPGLYVYLTAPSVAIFGLSEFAVRLPSAISGILIVYLFYLLACQIVKSTKYAIYTETGGLVAACIVAVNPQLVHFSRGAWVPNLAICLTLAGIYFFFMALTKQKYLLLSSTFFATTLLAYQGAKLSTLIIGLLLVLVFFKDLVKFDRRILAMSLIAGFIIALPIIASMFNGKTGRLGVVSIFSYHRSIDDITGLLSEGNEAISGATFKLFHSDGLFIARSILSRYANHFSGRFIFFEGDWEHPRHGTPYIGIMLLADLVLLILGIVAMASDKISKHLWFIILLLLFSPLPAVLTRDQVHVARSMYMLVPLLLLATYGVVYLWANYGKKKYILPMLILPLIYLANSLYFLEAYFVHMPIHNAKYWDFGYREIAQTIIPIQDAYQKIIVQQSYEQPFIYFLFYGAQQKLAQYQPVAIQQQLKLAESSVGDVGLVTSLYTIEFRPYSWPLADTAGTLVAGDWISIPAEYDREKYTLIKEIFYPGGASVAFRILEQK